jgi:hypothetical protein
MCAAHIVELMWHYNNIVVSDWKFSIIVRQKNLISGEGVLVSLAYTS